MNIWNCFLHLCFLGVLPQYLSACQPLIPGAGTSISPLSSTATCHVDAICSMGMVTLGDLAVATAPGSMPTMALSSATSEDCQTSQVQVTCPAWQTVAITTVNMNSNRQTVLLTCSKSGWTFGDHLITSTDNLVTCVPACIAACDPSMADLSTNEEEGCANGPEIALPPAAPLCPTNTLPLGTSTTVSCGSTTVAIQPITNTGKTSGMLTCTPIGWQYTDGSTTRIVTTSNQITCIECLTGLPVTCRQEVDFTIVLDSSGSIGSENFVTVLDFTSRIVEGLPSTSKVAALSYSTDVHPQFNFDQYGDVSAAAAAILDIPYNSGGTNTGAALEFVSNSWGPGSEGNRPNVVDIIVVVTDGEASDSPIPHAETLRATGATIIAVGVGNANAAELVGLTGDADLVFIVSSFVQLDDQLMDLVTLATGICDSNP